MRVMIVCIKEPLRLTPTMSMIDVCWLRVTFRRGIHVVCVWSRRASRTIMHCTVFLWCWFWLLNRFRWVTCNAIRCTRPMLIKVATNMSFNTTTTLLWGNLTGWMLPVWFYLSGMVRTATWLFRSFPSNMLIIWWASWWVFSQ